MRDATRWGAADNLVPDQSVSRLLGGLLAKVALIDPGTVLLEVGLIKNRDTVVRTARKDQSGRADKPILPFGKVQRGKFRNIRHGSDDRATGEHGLGLEPSNRVLAMNRARTMGFSFFVRLLSHGAP
jgi:hypothetical protein